MMKDIGTVAAILIAVILMVKAFGMPASAPTPTKPSPRIDDPERAEIMRDLGFDVPDRTAEPMVSVLCNGIMLDVPRSDVGATIAQGCVPATAAEVRERDARKRNR